MIHCRNSRREGRGRNMDMRKRTGRDAGAGHSTVVARPAGSTALIYVVFTLAGAGTGRLVGPLAHWLVTLPWAPMQGPARLLASVPGVWLLAVGAAAGLAVALVAQYEQLAVRVSDEQVVLTRKDRRLEFPRDTVGAAFLDGGRLVLLGEDSGELAREECDLNTRRVADAFTRHGYAWTAGDPHRSEFSRWVPDTPGLPEGANAVLKARQRFLEKKGPADDDVRELRDELGRLGVVVRDEKRRQYWRALRG